MMDGNGKICCPAGHVLTIVGMVGVVAMVDEVAMVDDKTWWTTSLAGKVTGMLLQVADAELLATIAEPAALRAAVERAIGDLPAAARQEGPTEMSV